MSNVRALAPQLQALVVPSELRDLPAWLIWKFEKFRGDHKPRKVPYYTNGSRRWGKQGSSSDRSQLTTFSSARDAAIRDRCDGVGFAALPDFGFTFLDFDNCVDSDGELPSEVIDVVGRTYCEYSPSGRGVRAVLRGNLGNHKSPTTKEQFGFETFSSSGFVTITGNILPICEMLGHDDHIAPVDQPTRDFCDKRFGADVAAFVVDDFMAGHEPKLGLSGSEIRKMLLCLDPDMGRADWIKVGMALHHESGGNDTGFDLWDDWSSDGYTYPGTENLRDQWRSIRPTPGRRQVTMASVIRMAKENGYTVNTVVDAIPRDPRESGSQFHLLDRDAIMALPPLQWRVKRLLPETGIAAIYGPSGSGKSFLSFDLGMSIALGRPWFDHRTIASSVTYIILEGEAGLRNRIEAWESHNGTYIPDNFRAIAQPLQLADIHQVEQLGADLPQGGVTIIDTLNRATPGLDENSPQDMGRILSAMKRLQEITGGLVLIVHHTGKDTSKGLRGHSSLHAALDGAIEVVRNSSSRCWSAAKVKDGEDGKQKPFKLVVVELGTDADGDPINSCAIGADTEAEFRPSPPTGKHQKKALPHVESLIKSSCMYGKAGAPDQAQCVMFEDAVSEVAASLVGVETKRRLQSARAALQGLIEGGHLQSRVGEDGIEWLWSQFQK